jgi:hypothetical protein
LSGPAPDFVGVALQPVQAADKRAGGFGTPQTPTAPSQKKKPKSVLDEVRIRHDPRQNEPKCVLETIIDQTFSKSTSLNHISATVSVKATGNEFSIAEGTGVTGQIFEFNSVTKKGRPVTEVVTNAQEGSKVSILLRYDEKSWNGRQHAKKYGLETKGVCIFSTGVIKATAKPVVVNKKETE